MKPWMTIAILFLMIEASTLGVSLYQLDQGITFRKILFPNVEAKLTFNEDFNQKEFENNFLTF